MSYDVRFLKGTRVNYDNLPVKDANTFYYVDETDLYLGEILLSNAEEVAAAVQSIELNAQAIQTLQDELDALVDPEGTGGGSISTQINTLRTELSAMIVENEDAIKEEAARAKGAEAELSNSISTLGATVQTLQETVEANESDIEGKVSALGETINGQNNLLASLQGTIGELDDNLNALGGDVDAVEAAIATLVGSDAEKSVRKIANEELAAALIPEAAADSLDTLQEIAAWIQSHPEDVADINEAILTLQGNDATQSGKITSLEEAVAAINHAESGILAQAKGYADAEILKVSGSQEELEGAVSDLEEAIAAINHEDTGILAKAEEAIFEAIQSLGLGTAAYKDVDYFEKAGAAAAALNEAKAYTNEALTWGVIPAQSAE